MFKYDGHTRPITLEDIQLGMVVRKIAHEFHEDAYRQATDAFDDSVVIELSGEEVLRNNGDYVYLARPYLYANTLANGVIGNYLVGVEQINVSIESLITYYQVVVGSSGKPAIFNNK